MTTSEKQAYLDDLYRTELDYRHKLSGWTVTGLPNNVEKTQDHVMANRLFKAAK